MAKLNLTLPGSPRYQPKQLQEHFGYDNLYRGIGQVEIANLEVMAEIGFMPDEIALFFTTDAQAQLLELRTTDIDLIERQITKHDIRAWVYAAAKLVSERLANWLHVMLTSYDPLDTGRILQFVQAHRAAIKPSCLRVLQIMIALVRQYAGQLQIGRTHGQHALPITVGFWLATILYRMFYNFQKMELHSQELVGKISGAVGAYNAQVGLGALALCGDKSFETRVLEKLGLKPAPVSTQILPPDPLAYYLFSCCMLSASFAQLGTDCRQLMRSEIGEVAEQFEKGATGSSTMAHKRNPTIFEQIVAMWIKNKNEFGKVQDTLISEHQRDLTGSAVARDFPIIVVNLANQLNALLREDKEKKVPFLNRITISPEACHNNFMLNRHVILSEPLYIAIQMAGYRGHGEHDGHHLVNHTLVPKSQETKRLLVEVAAEYAEEDLEFREAWQRIPQEIISLLHQPEQYTGLAQEKALEIADMVDRALAI